MKRKCRDNPHDEMVCSTQGCQLSVEGGSCTSSRGLVTSHGIISPMPSYCSFSGAELRPRKGTLRNLGKNIILMRLEKLQIEKLIFVKIKKE